ncbi:alpha/beta-hydrolase [Tothia fuscella]|uniref:cutinase n=1 Tax=Tothia fuscella TaxID=1048955 RepID=A0A9P4NX77_9PEZI|nr:alpha/beta-hydrolase [Tothia fuscella]
MTQDDVLDRQGCRSMTILFAADSQEYGNVGSWTGPSFFQALASKIGGRQELSLQGIDYPVDYHVYSDEWDYFELKDMEGPRVVAKLAAQVMESCPLTHLVLGGYGQGSEIMHNAATQMQKNLLDFVRAVVIFGEGSHTKRVGYAGNGKAGQKIKAYCRGLDPFCLGREAIGDTRITYTRNAAQAAHFVLQKVIDRR